jgi:hypothetical protein
MNQNEQRQAVALGYAAKKDVAPRLVVKGRGYLAEKIIEWRGCTIYRSVTTGSFCRFFPVLISKRKSLPKSIEWWRRFSLSFTA